MLESAPQRTGIGVEFYSSSPVHIRYEAFNYSHYAESGWTA